MALSRLRKNDTVWIRTGKDAGRRGRVLAFFRETGTVLVEKVNVVKRATKPNPRTGQGGLLEKEAPVPASRVALVCPKCDKPTRVRARREGDGPYARACGRCSERIG